MCECERVNEQRTCVKMKHGPQFLTEPKLIPVSCEYANTQREKMRVASDSQLKNNN